MKIEDFVKKYIEAHENQVTLGEFAESLGWKRTKVSAVCSSLRRMGVFLPYLLRSDYGGTWLIRNDIQRAKEMAEAYNNKIGFVPKKRQNKSNDRLEYEL